MVLEATARSGVSVDGVHRVATVRHPQHAFASQTACERPQNQQALDHIPRSKVSMPTFIVEKRCYWSP
ncbi:MAG: hypothetical protein QOD39_1229 [Mycobacterium sp.]|nr:hypothetical protein [Mycobacterium sp.]